MKLLEKIALSVIVLGITLRLFIVPGGIALTVFSLFLTGLLYLIAGFWLLGYMDKKNGVKQNMTGLSIGAGIAFFFGLIAILMKIMFWSGSTIELVTASILLFLLLIAASILFSQSVKRKLYYKLLMIRSSVLLVLVIFLLYTDNNSIYRVFHRNDPVLIQKWEYMNAHPDDNAAAEDFYNYQDTLQ
ncbi:MAG: hypothetical protein K0S33_3870 [Bacteroidetes bacterium]|jgi:hypothetical protein|nr:hypothetical protein [Bacteroidota bacterium]